MEIILPFRTPHPGPCAEARSTLIIAALQTLRAQGLYDAYVECVTPSLRQELMSLVAGIWVPIALAVEHYKTMERLELPKSIIEAIGAEVAERAFKTVLAAPPQPQEGSPTPWDVLRSAHRNLDNNWRGSDIMVTKEGPEHATVVWTGQPCASVPYFVTSWGAFLRARVNLYSTRAIHRIVRERSSPLDVVVELSWI
jgi:hypothetical protein